MITAYRIFNTAHATNWSDGEGAFQYGGRWNSPGVRMLYAAGSLALATLEMLVHLEDEEVLADYSYAAVRFEENLMLPVEKIGQLPSNWREFPIPDAVRQIGNKWVQSGASAVLRVPTAILPREFNYMVNLEHQAAGGVKFGGVEQFVFDKRFVERSGKKS